MANIIVNPGAIDKLQSDVGDVSNLTTSAKNSLVAAVNEHEGDITSLNSKIDIQALTATEGIKTIARDDTRCPVNQVRWFNLRQSDSSELPGSGQVYSIARVVKRASGLCFIELFQDSGAIWRTSYDGSSWSAWDSLALNSRIDSQFNTQITDLNAPLTAGKNVITFNAYLATASNKPGQNDGFCITYGAGNYRQQTAFELTGEIYSRYYANGTISQWVRRST